MITAILLAAAALQTGAQAQPAPKTIYEFRLKDIDGKPVSLGKYRGKVLLVVNVASKCGNTPQYKGLEALYREKRRQGLVVLGFPANNFNQQEPGTDSEIKAFCTGNYGVTFPMFSKLSVRGEDQAPLYAWLQANSDRPSEPVEWNFTKFVIGRDGKVFRRLLTKDTPESPAVRNAIDEALAAR